MKNNDSSGNDAIDALLKVICEIKNNGRDFVNVIDPETMAHAEGVISAYGFEVLKSGSWVPGHDFYHAEKKLPLNAKEA